MKLNKNPHVIEIYYHDPGLNLRLLEENSKQKEEKYVNYISGYIKLLPLDIFTDSKLKSSEFIPESTIFPRILSLSFNKVIRI